MQGSIERVVGGEFAEGWREYEWRLRLPGTAGGIPPDDVRRWDGKPMPDGNLLLFADQGRGDIRTRGFRKDLLVFVRQRLRQTHLDAGEQVASSGALEEAPQLRQNRSPLRMSTWQPGQAAKKSVR